MLKIRIGAVTVTLGCIYGPNHDDKNFFKLINEKTDSFKSDFVIIGGDWNTAYDIQVSRINIDILNTTNLPSARRSLWLSQLCNNRQLVDPYRPFYPEANEFTYVPFAAGAINRSR
jgi:hypothetical protein